jgi:hypothetical protein
MKGKSGKKKDEKTIDWYRKWDNNRRNNRIEIGYIE